MRVNKAFTPSSLTTKEQQIEDLTNELLDEAEPKVNVDLVQAYALPIPLKVISALMGVSDGPATVIESFVSSLFQPLGSTGSYVSSTNDTVRASSSSTLF